MRYSSLALLVACALAADAVPAANPTITFNGTVTDQTCTVTVNGQQDIELTLPTVHAGAFTGKDTVVGNLPFTVTISGCKDRKYVDAVKVVFTGQNVVDGGYLRNISTDNPAGGIAIRLTQGEDGTNPINLSNPEDAYVKIQLPESKENFATHTLAVQYISLDDTVTPGKVLAKVEYEMKYL